MSTERNWNEVTTTVTPSSSRLEVGNGTLESTGVLRLSTASSGDWDFVLRSSKLDLATCVSKFFVDGQLVSAWPVPHGTTGGTGFRQRYVKGGKTKLATLYLHGVFAQHPELRPAGKCKVAVTRETGKDGVAYLLINLQSQIAVRTVPRD